MGEDAVEIMNRFTEYNPAKGEEPETRETVEAVRRWARGEE